jgi:hypothetical protein
MHFFMSFPGLEQLTLNMSGFKFFKEQERNFSGQLHHHQEAIQNRTWLTATLFWIVNTNTHHRSGESGGMVNGKTWASSRQTGLPFWATKVSCGPTDCLKEW